MRIKVRNKHPGVLLAQKVNGKVYPIPIKPYTVVFVFTDPFTKKKIGLAKHVVLEPCETPKLVRGELDAEEYYVPRERHPSYPARSKEIPWWKRGF